MPESIQFSQVIQALLDKVSPLPPRYLHSFSDLEPGEFKQVLVAWPEVSLQRKLSLLEDLEALAEADTVLSFDTLARPLLSDPEAGVRTRAIHLLWECFDVKLVPIFLDIFNKDENDETRGAAASILGLYISEGELGKLPPIILHTIEEDLLQASLKGASSLVCRRALESLGASSRQEVIPLIETAFHRKEVDWIVSALHAMGRSDDNRWEKYVVGMLENQDEEISSEAIRAAGKLELACARLPLLDLLADEEDLERRREIFWALSGIGGEGIRDMMEELLDLEADEDEVSFLEEAYENLLLTEDLNQFDLLEIDMDEDSRDEG